MTITKKAEDSKLTIALEGNLDTLTSPELENELDLDGVSELVFDFDKLEYISSAGLRVILGAMKAMTKQGGTMKVVNVEDAIMEIFNITGFADIMDIEEK